MATDQSRSSDAGVKAPAGHDWITPIKNTRAFEEIIEQLEGALLSGRLVAGARLPAERDLAAALDVSRASVREALRVLEALGIVDIQRGPLGAALRREPGDAFAYLLRLQLALGHFEPNSLVELRCVLESWAFGQLARRRDGETLQRMQKLLAQMEQPEVTPLEFNDLDIDFHSAVISASGNELAASVLRGCRTVIRREMLEGLASGGAWPENAKSLTHEHRELYELVRNGEVDAVSAYVDHHIRRWAARSLALGTLPGAVVPQKSTGPTLSQSSDDAVLAP